MRAMLPVESGTVKLHGYQVGYELFGDPQAPPVMLLPTWRSRNVCPQLTGHSRRPNWLWGRWPWAKVAPAFALAICP